MREGHRPRGRGAGRLPFLRAQRDHVPLRARRPAHPRLTLASRGFFDAPPDGFTDAPLGRRMPVLVHARETSARSTHWTPRFRRFANSSGWTSGASARICPLLNDGDERHGRRHRNGIRLDHMPAPGLMRASSASRRMDRDRARVSRIERSRDRVVGPNRAGERAFGAHPRQRGGRLGGCGGAISRAPAARPEAATPDDHHLRCAGGDRPRETAVRQDGRRRALFRAGNGPAVRLADGRSADRSVRCAARRI